MKNILLNNNWNLQFLDNTSGNFVIPDSIKNRWIKAEIPGTVHTDLLRANLIPDPFFSDNEISLQWIGESDWLFQNKFDLPDGFDKSKPIFLLFEGIDTKADVRLNGILLGKAENMFRKYQFEISKILKEKGNQLDVHLISAVSFSRNLENKYGRLPVALRSERVYIRKAQYSFGWDWGPTFITSGIWKPIYLQQYTNKINDILFKTKFISTDTAEVEVQVELDKKLSEKEKLMIILNDSEFNYQKEINNKNTNKIRVKVKLKNPKLWQPNGYGEQHLYNLSVRLFTDNKLEDEETKQVGIRTIELKLKHKNKNAFQFIVNGNPSFCKGVNWIPADSFLPGVTEDKYRTLLQMVKDANMNIVRVWGGGIYEQDVFYNICDELGLMVWQDFMFACASYPEEKSFLKNVEAEVNENVKRLQHHPSIIIWCGNNENEWIWTMEQKRSYKEMPGYKIFSELIPNLVNKIDTSRPYWESSPFSFEDDPNSVLSGNRHQWDIWSRWIDYKNVKDDDSLFVTEFGFQSPANSDTILSVLPKGERNISSRIFEFHNKQVEGPERLMRFLAGHLPIATEIEDYIYLTQLNHAFAMKECLEHWRFRFPKTNGSIIWQINDCWPVASWALVDSKLIPKLPYYFVKKIFAPQSLRLCHSNNSIKLLSSNFSLQDFTGSIVLQSVLLPKGKIELIEEQAIDTKSLQIKEVLEYSLNKDLNEGKEILIASLYSKDEELLSRTFYNHLEWKYLKLPQANVTVEKKKGNLLFSTDLPAFFIYIENQNRIDDNGFILLPGEQHLIKNPNGKISFKYLNEYLIQE